MALLAVSGKKDIYKCFKLSMLFKLNFIFYCYNYSLQYVKLYVRAPAPRLESAWFNKMYCSLTLMFDASVEGPENCRQLFDEASYQKLGHSKNKIIIELTFSFPDLDSWK